MFFSQAQRQSEGRRHTDLKIKLPPGGERAPSVGAPYSTRGGDKSRRSVARGSVGERAVVPRRRHVQGCSCNLSGPEIRPVRPVRPVRVPVSGLRATN